MVHKLGRIAAVVPAAWLIFPAGAQDTTPSGLEEVVVTAQRRAENLQRVPIVVHAVDAEIASQRGITNVQDLGNIAPGFLYNRSTNSGLVFLRGVGAGTGAAGEEGPVAFYLDGVYLYSLNANLFELNNVERVEVAAGPQGTLFGRNALGGVVQVLTRDPSHEPALDLNVGYGNFSTTRGDMYGTVGLGDTLAADFSVLYYNRDEGLGHNLATDREVFLSDQRSARTKWLWTPAEGTTVRFSASYDKYRDDVGIVTRLLPGSLGRDGVSTAPLDFFDVNANFADGFRNESAVGTLNVTQDFGWGSLVSISAYQDNYNYQTNDADQVPAFITHQYPVRVSSETWSQELQFVSRPESTISWIAGLYYLNNTSAYHPARINSSPTAFFDIISKMKTDSYAAYTQGTFPLGQKTRLTGGVRYTHDTKDVAGGNFSPAGVQLSGGAQSKSWPKVTFRASLEQDLGETVLGYVSFNRGFKSGTFNTTAPADPPVNPQVIDAYELGLKTELLDRRLRLNVAGFYYDYQDMQIRQVLPTGTRLLNAAEARHYGVDVMLEAAIGDRLSLQAAAEWLNAEFTKFPGAPATQRNPLGGNVTIPTDFTGRDVFFAPDLTGNIGFQYRIPSQFGTFLWAASYQYIDSFSWSPEIDDRTRQQAYELVNMSLQWTHPSESWNIKLWGKNITDSEYNSFVNTNAQGDYGSPGLPATYGVTLGVNF